jgi:hypothetical protein
LDLVQVDRQVAVGPDAAPENIRDHLLVGRPIEHRPLVTVGDPQHLLAVIVVTAALLPELGRLDRRHEDLVASGAVHLLADDLLNAAQHAQAERQPTIDAGRALADHARTKHELVRHDLRLGGRLLEQRQKVTRQPHLGSRSERDRGGATLGGSGTHDNSAPVGRSSELAWLF